MGKFEAVENNGTAFPPKQCLYQKVAVGMENLKMQSPSQCNKRTVRYDPGNNPVSCTAYTAVNGNLGNIEAVENNDTAFAPKQCLYQKVAVGLESSKLHSPSRCNKRTGRYGPAKTRFHAPRIAQRMEICELQRCQKQWYRLCTKAIFISKGICGYGETKNAIPFSVQYTHRALRPSK